MDSCPKLHRYRRFYLLTHPRSCSNLLVRILSFGDQPDVVQHDVGQGYFFLPIIKLREDLKLQGKNVEEWTQNEQDQMKQTCQNCFQELQKHVEAAETEDKIIFVKEHVYFMTEPTALSRFLFGQEKVKQTPWTVQISSTYGSEATRSSLNKTLLPDEFLKTWLPTFLIRHPALMFPSHYRTIVDTLGVEAAHAEGERSEIMTLHWTRLLYDWYTENLTNPGTGSTHDTRWPLLLDADDIINSPDVVVRLCEVVGMDPKKLHFEWKPAEKGYVDQLNTDVSKRMRSTLTASAGIMTEKSSADIDISTEANKWREEFGQIEGEKIEGWVKAAMPDYEYLWAKRLKPRTL
ncbi:hypothetical protein MMC11_003214 [Xylographa trunciseda]|nr:hypothetical protein [Xylographa trunciseda]